MNEENKDKIKKEDRQDAASNEPKEELNSGCNGNHREEGEEKDWKMLYEKMRAEHETMLAEFEKAKEEIKSLEEEAARARADYYNLRNRVERDRERDSKLAAEKAVRDLLPVFENLERVCDAIEDKEGSLYKGIMMVANQFWSAMENLGLERIPAEGEFDPALHEAVSVEPVSDEADDGHIIDELRKGYKLAGRVIRAPQVRIGKYKSNRE